MKLQLLSKKTECLNNNVDTEHQELRYIFAGRMMDIEEQIATLWLEHAKCKLYRDRSIENQLVASATLS